MIEQYTRNVRFCIICNYVNKIIPAIQSRCTRFRFSPLHIKEVQKKVEEVMERENVVVTPDGKAALLKLSKGDMRRALNILQVSKYAVYLGGKGELTEGWGQACHAAYDVTGEKEIYLCTGNPQPAEIEMIVKSMMTEDFTSSFNSPSSTWTFEVYILTCWPFFRNHANQSGEWVGATGPDRWGLRVY